MKKNKKKILTLKKDNFDNSLQLNSTDVVTIDTSRDEFNDLTKKIYELETFIFQEEQKLSNLLDFQIKKLRPLLFEGAKLRLDLSKSLSFSTTQVNYSKNQIEDISIVITSLCEQSFILIDPNKDDQIFYQEWSGKNYQNEIDIQNYKERESIAEKFSKQYGINISPDDFDNSPESLARFEAKLKENHDSNFQDNVEAKKKTNREKKLELNLKEEDDIKTKSIRSIYIMLAKMLHPDSEMDPKKKIEKEEIMKKVTKAYEEKDFSTLLKLEMECIKKESEHINDINDVKLDKYIKLLRDQVKNLEIEKNKIYLNPRFSSIFKYSQLSEKNALIRMKADIREQNLTNEYFKHLIKDINNFMDKKQIVEFINYYLQALNH